MSAPMATSPLFAFAAEAFAPARAPARVRPIVRGAFLLFIASIAFDWPAPLNPTGMELPTVGGFILLAASLTDLRRCYPRLPGAVVLFMTYLWCFVVAAVAASVTQLEAVTRLFFNMTQVVLLCWLMTTLLRDRALLRAALVTLVVACSIRATLQLLGIGTQQEEQWTGGMRTITLGQNANLSALILAGGLMATVGLHRSRLGAPRWLHLLAWPIAALLATAVIQTGSRGGLAASGAGLAIFALHGSTVFARVRNMLVTATALGLLAYAAWQTPMMRSRLTDSATTGHLAGREAIYPAALRMLRERPLLGWGPIANQYEIARRTPQRGLARSDVHNLMLELLTATGLLAAVPFLAALGIALRGAARARRGPAGLLPLSLLAMCLTGTLSGTWIAAKILWFSIAFGIASDLDASVPVPPEA